MRSLFFFAVSFLASCSFSKMTGSGSSSGPSGSSAVTMPDLSGKSPGEALALLRGAGFQIDQVEEMSGRLCTDETAGVPQDTICEQQPAAGSQTFSRAPVRVVVQHDTATHGTIGGDEWRLMPDLKGKTVAEARTILTGAGLDFDKNFELFEGACATDTVCDTRPYAGQRIMMRRGGKLAIGKAETPAGDATLELQPAGSFF